MCETDIPMSVGIVEPKTHPSQLNAAEFLWDLNKRTSVFVQVTHTPPHSHTPTHTHTSSFTHAHLLSVGRSGECPNQIRTFLSRVSLLSTGALHQHRVHSQEARRGEGRPLQDPVGHVCPGRRRRVHRAPPLRILPNQSL